MEPVEIILSAPIEWHKKAVMKITLNPPSTRDYLNFGEPRIPVRNSDGTFYFIDKDETIKKYVNAMVDHEGGDMLIELISFIDARRVKGAVLGFFDRADTIIYAPKSAPSSST